MKKDNRSRSRADKAAPKTRPSSKVVNVPSLMLKQATKLQTLLDQAGFDTEVVYLGAENRFRLEHEGVTVDGFMPQGPVVKLEFSTFITRYATIEEVPNLIDLTCKGIKARKEQGRWSRIKAFFKR